MKRKTSDIPIVKHLTLYASYLLVFWGFYRLLFKLPEEIEEFFIKPLVWLIPVFFILVKEKMHLSSLGITLKNLFPSVYLSLGLGSVFVFVALISNYLKYKGFNFSSDIGDKLILSSFLITTATAISEELSVRGYVFSRLEGVLKNTFSSAFITSIFWTLLHIPITVFVWKYSLTESLGFLFLTFLFGMGACFVYSRTKNIVSAILLHILWQWPIILFK